MNLRPTSIMVKPGAEEIVSVEMSEGSAQESITAHNFEGNGTLTILYPTPDWLLSWPVALESQEIIDVLELFRSW